MTLTSMHKNRNLKNLNFMTLTIKKYFNLLRIICYSWFAMNDMAKPGVKYSPK